MIPAEIKAERPYTRIIPHTETAPVEKREPGVCSLDVVFREFADAPTGGTEALESIIQSYFDSTSRIIKNMVMTPEERRVLEERRERLESLREAVKERKIEEQNARLELKRIMSEESVPELESAISERIV